MSTIHFHIDNHGLDIILRPWLNSDIDSLVLHANNPSIAKFMTDGFPHPYTKHHGEQFVERVTQFMPPRFFAITLNEEAIGGIGIHPQEDIMRMNAELGYWLSEKFWGKGIISGAISEIVKYGFTQFNIDRIFARPFGSNTGSQKVLEKAGFTLEARLQETIIKNGQKEDELIYAIRRV